jgi:hypothetical protein
MRCSAAKYQIVRGSSDREADSQLLETETSFSFIPSRWVINLGISYIVQFGIIRSSTQGLNLTLRTFNVGFMNRLSDSLELTFTRLYQAIL